MKPFVKISYIAYASYEIVLQFNKELIVGSDKLEDQLNKINTEIGNMEIWKMVT